MHTNSSHKTGLLFTLFLAIQSLSPDVCADTPGATGHLPRNSLNYDQIVARIPMDQAPIRSVALANLNIALHYARQQAVITRCDGQWTPRGPVVFRQGPAIVQGSSHARVPRVSSWHYVALRQPGILACDTGSRAAFFLEMSRYLPAWVQIRPAGQLTAFRQGEAVLPVQEAVAIK
ncbi:MAG: hypothetical protein ACE5FQ_07850 [Thiogranum sp.]